MNETPKGCDQCPALDMLAHLIGEQADTLDAHERLLKAHDEQLGRGNVDFAVINTKLNVMIGAMAVIGAAVVAVVVPMLF